MVRFLATLLLLPAVCPASRLRAETKPWIEVHSPNFRVITDGTEHQARVVAAEFEQMRSVFATNFKSFRLDSGAPLMIVAARDYDSAEALEPQLYKRDHNVAGEFHQGWEKRFAMIRLDTWGDGSHHAVYHEYIHSILHMNARWLPVWLDEGLAEYYGNTRFRSDKTYLGALPEDERTLFTHSLIPVETLLAVDRRSPYYHDANLVPVFYADSWALVHYMTFGPEMQGGAKLNQFFNLLQKGVAQKEAFVQAFGDMASFNTQWGLYMRRFAFNAAVIPATSGIDEKSFAARKLTPAETELELGAFHIGSGDVAAGEHLVDAALVDDPKLAAAHEEKGYLLFKQGDTAEARNQFTTAYSLDPTLYRSLFAKTMLSREVSSTVPAEMEVCRASLEKVTELNPKFAPAFIELAELALRQRDFNTALKDSRKAESLEPSRAGYHLLTGRILVDEGQSASAAQFATYVADRWFGPDRDEAYELWQAIPASLRPSGAAVTQDPELSSVQNLEGTVDSTHCGDTPKEPFTVTLAPGGAPAHTFVRKHGFTSGFSDTLWYGEDHFSVCHNLEGLRAVVYYRPSSDPQYTGELVSLELRDAPAVAPRPSSAIAASPGTQASSTGAVQ